MNFSRVPDRLLRPMRAEKAHRAMDDRVEAFEIEPSYEREDPFPRGPRVLWGRVAALSGGVILAFLIGHQTGGGPSTDARALQRPVDQDKTTIAQLQQSLAAASAGPTTSPNPTTSLGAGTTPLPATSTTPTSTVTAPAGTSAGSNATVTVKSGDTLGAIISHYYGHTNHD